MLTSPGLSQPLGSQLASDAHQAAPRGPRCRRTVQSGRAEDLLRDSQARSRRTWGPRYVSAPTPWHRRVPRPRFTAARGSPVLPRPACSLGEQPPLLAGQARQVRSGRRWPPLNGAARTPDYAADQGAWAGDRRTRDSDYDKRHVPPARPSQKDSQAQRSPPDGATADHGTWDLLLLLPKFRQHRVQF